MISEEQLDQYRLDGTKVRVIRDDNIKNDVRGIVVAWTEDKVLIRKPNRKIVELSRAYVYQAASENRPESIF